MVIAAVLVLAGVGLGVLRYAGASAPEDGVERVAGAVALASVVAVVGLLVVLARADRPVLLLPAAVVLVPLSLLSFAGVTLPLLVPVVVLGVAYRRRSADNTVAGWRAVLIVSLVLVLVVLATVALFVHPDPRASTFESTSDVITPVEALVTLAVLGLAVSAAWHLSAPSPQA